MNLITRTIFLTETETEIYKKYTHEEVTFLLKVCIEEVERYIWYKNNTELFKNDVIKINCSKRLVEMSKRVIAKYLQLNRGYGYYFYNNKWMEDLPQ